MTTGGHRETVNLWFDINNLLGICLQPGNVDLNVKVANAVGLIRQASKEYRWCSLANNGVLRH